MRVLWLTLLCSAALAWWACQTPDPLPDSADPRAFAAGRALHDITALAQEPRPVGSPAHDVAARYLEGRLQQLGFEVRVQEATRRGKSLRNLIALRPGLDHQAEPVTLMAHYDSVLGSPGAADDATGVAVALEVARALQVQGQPLRDLVLVFTDGEELGLLGAKAFYEEDALAGRLGPVLNMEARGGGGRVYMFETSDHNGALVELFRKVTRNPSSNSLSVFLYRLMPNDTDFTVVRRHGGTGLNYAFIGREVDFHEATSTAARLDAGSVQHMGNQVLAMAQALASSPRLPARAADLVYADVLGATTIAYAPAVGWLLLAMALIALVIATRRARAAGARWPTLLAGAGSALAILLLSAGAAWLARQLVGPGHGHGEHLRLLGGFGRFELALALASLGVVILVAALAGAGAGQAGTWAGATAFAWLLAALAQYYAPATAFLVAWPLLAASIGLLLAPSIPAISPWRHVAFWPGAILAVAAIAQCLYLAHGMLLGVGATIPMAAGLFAWLASLNLWPWLAQGATRARGMAIGGGFVACGFMLALSLRWVP
jgi:hypothetical protein